ncbi:MAG: Ig-like domain-containing protein, partial [Lentisphaerae bacterium]|nr:Ig-like domain-containing protein [Lentisphaerota bacterium]
WGAAVTGVNSPTVNGTYDAAGVISVEVTYDLNVVVAGTPQLALETGSSNAVVNYSGGSGSSVLQFNYTVAAGHNSLDLDYTGTGSLILNGGTINDQASGLPATNTLPVPGAANSLGFNKALIVDTAPVVWDVTSTNVDRAYGLGQYVDVRVTFSEDVTVAGGAPVLTLATAGSSNAVCNYFSGSPGLTLIFPYTVTTGQLSADLTYTGATALVLGAATIQDSGARNAVLTLPAPGAGGSLDGNKNIVVDGVAPTLFALNPLNGAIQVPLANPLMLTLDEPVTNGTGNIEIRRRADNSLFQNVSVASTNVFCTDGNSNVVISHSIFISTTEYYIVVSNINLHDAGSNFFGGFSGFATWDFTTVDGVVPTISSITSVTPDGRYPAGSNILVVVNFSEDVTLAGGSLRVGLDTGGQVTFTDFGPARTVTGIYTVAAGETSADLDSTNIVLVSGTLRDAATNNAVVALPAITINDGSAIVIDTTAPTVTTVTSPNPNGTYGPGAAITIQVNFSEPVILAGGTLDVTLDTGATLNFPPFGPAASASAIYTVAAGQNSADLNNINIQTSGGSTFTDVAGNPFLTFTPTTTLGMSKNIVVDTLSPTVTITSTAGDHTNVSPIPIQIRFTESMSGFAVGDVSVTGGTISGFAGATSNYTFNVTPSAQGTVIVSVGGGVATDPAGNGNQASVAFTCVYDTTRPTVSITSPLDDPVGTSPIPVVVTFSEAVTNFVSSDLTLGNGVAAEFKGTGAVYTFSLIPMAPGDVTVDVTNGVAVDLSGNLNLPSHQFSRVYEFGAPTGVSASDGTYTDRIRVSWTVMSEASSYQVWRGFTNSFGSASQAGTAASPPYDDTSAGQDRKYFYWIKPVNNYGAAGAESTPDSGWRSLAAPGGVSASDSEFTDRVVVQWQSVSGATGYQVWRSVSNTSASASQLAIAGDTPYLDMTAETPTYFYWVKATNTLGPSPFSGFDSGSRATYADASDSPLLGWTTGTNAPWFGQSVVTHDGVDAVQSGDILNSQSSWLRANAYGPGSFSFWWKVSSETNYDFLSFFINGVEQSKISGVVDWRQRSYMLAAGTNLLEWVYAKDNTISTNQDAAWVDQAVFLEVPSGVLATDGAFVNKIRVTWNGSFVGVNSYEVWRSELPDTTMASRLAVTNSTAYEDTRVTPGTVYYYWIRSISTSGTSGYSEPDTGFRRTATADYDGDSISDLAVFDGVAGNWYILSLAHGIVALGVSWGVPGQTSTFVPGDYDANGRCDLAMYFDDTGTWNVKTLTDVVYAWGLSWGFSGARPVAGDYNGDGRADFAVYAPDSGSWYVWTWTNQYTFQWGWAGTEALPGDFDGDGASDLAIYDRANSRWFIRALEDRIVAWDFAWGWNTAELAPGDYDGDGASDIALYDRNTGNWYIRSISGPVLAWGVNWGFPGVELVPGDYDGDGKTDLAVFDPLTGNWYIRSMAGNLIVWGGNWGWPGASVVK